MLTELTIRKLTPKGNARIELWDDKMPGFGVRVSPRGTKSFVLMYYVAGRKRRLTLGRFPTMSLAKARNVMRRLNRCRAESPPIRGSGPSAETLG